MDKKKLQEQYNILFQSDKEKAKAFDKIAKQFYFCNFGTMQKSDLETLMFSLYLDRILELSEDEETTYSDYTLSKYLGITQNRISALKVKKELKYPYFGFDWKKSFMRTIKHARYENGKVKMNITDKNLYLEIKNAIESEGGYIEVQLNPTLLQISLEYYIDLLLIISGNNKQDRGIMQKRAIESLKRYNQNRSDINAFETMDLSDILRGNIGKITINVVREMLSSELGKLSPTMGALVDSVLQSFKNVIYK